MPHGRNSFAKLITIIVRAGQGQQIKLSKLAVSGGWMVWVGMGMGMGMGMFIGMGMEMGMGYSGNHRMYRLCFHFVVAFFLFFLEFFCVSAPLRLVVCILP